MYEFDIRYIHRSFRSVPVSSAQKTPGDAIGCRAKHVRYFDMSTKLNDNSIYRNFDISDMLYIETFDNSIYFDISFRSIRYPALLLLRTRRTSGRPNGNANHPTVNISPFVSYTALCLPTCQPCSSTSSTFTGTAAVGTLYSDLYTRIYHTLVHNGAVVATFEKVEMFGAIEMIAV